MIFDAVRIETRQIYLICSWDIKSRPMVVKDFWCEPIIAWCFNPETLGWLACIHGSNGKLIAACKHENLLIHGITFEIPEQLKDNAQFQLSNYVEDNLNA